MKEKKTPTLDPKGRYLIQDSGHIYIYSEALAARKDMKPYFPGERSIDPVEVEKKVPIELQGKTFMVAPDLHTVLAEMGGVMVEMQEENARLKAEAADFEAFKVRMDTDKTDLEEQLEAARAEIAGLKTDPEPEQPAPDKKKGK